MGRCMGGCGGVVDDVVWDKCMGTHHLHMILLLYCRTNALELAVELLVDLLQLISCRTNAADAQLMKMLLQLGALRWSMFSFHIFIREHRINHLIKSCELCTKERKAGASSSVAPGQ